MDKMQETLAKLAKLVEGEVQGDPDTVVTGLANIDDAAEGDITFITSPDKRTFAAAGKAAAVIAARKFGELPGNVIWVKNPNVAAAVIHMHFISRPFLPAGIHPSAIIGENCSIAAEVSIGPGVIIDSRVEIAAGVTIGAGVFVGKEVIIQSDSHIRPNVTILDKCVIGCRVLIHSGAVIGSDGFGFATDEQGYHYKRPHVGIVQIDDDVEIGACTCIDRGTFGKTWIRSGAKIDNLVHIAHNVTIGENTILAAQVGIAGSTSIGRNVAMGGQSGVSSHVTVGDRTQIAGKAGVISNLEGVPVVSGMPAMAHRSWLKSSLLFGKLPELAKKIQQLEKEIELLKDFCKSAEQKEM